MTGAIIAIPVVLIVTGGTTGIAVSWFRLRRRRAGWAARAGPAADTAGIAGGVVAFFAARASTGSHGPDGAAAWGRKR